MQIVDAMIDQRLHGVGAAGRSISDTVQEVMEEHSVFPFVPGTCPQARSAPAVLPHVTCFVVVSRQPIKIYEL